MDNKYHFKFAEIVLSDNKSRYQAGEDVSGIVRFSLKGPTAKVTHVQICLICVSEVGWIEIPNTTTYIGTNFTGLQYTYRDKIMLIEETFPLPKEFENLSEGEHEVPFKFKLPEKGIHSSFVGPHGSIKYFIEVIDEEPGVNESHEVKVLFEFKVDVPSDQNLSLSIGCSKEKDFGFLSFDSGKLTIYADLKKKGWVPGEVIQLDVTVDNQSNVDVTPRAILYQLQVYMCEQGHKALQIELSDTMSGKKVEKNQSSSETLFISTPKDTSLTIKSPLISVKYFVHVTLDIPYASDIQVDVPIVMTNKSVESAD